MRFWLVAWLILFTNCVKAAQTFTVIGNVAANPINLEFPGWLTVDGNTTNKGSTYFPALTVSQLLRLDFNNKVSSVILGSGLSLSGTTLSIDISSLPTDGSPDGAFDYVITYDASAATLKKVLLNNLPGGGGGGGISDAAFSSAWNGVTATSPSKNAVYDQFHFFDVNDNGKVDVLDLSVAGIVRSTSGGVPSSGELTGDITTSGTFATTIANNAVTYGKMQDVTVTQRVLGRNTAGAGDPEEVTLSQLLDWIGTAAQGDVLFRGSSSWNRLAAGTSGQFLQTQGTGANPQWATGSGAQTPWSTDIDGNLKTLSNVKSITDSNLTLQGAVIVTSYNPVLADLDWNRAVYAMDITVNTNITFSNIAADKAITLYLTNRGQFTLGVPTYVYSPFTYDRSFPGIESNAVTILRFEKVGNGFTNGYVIGAPERQISSSLASLGAAGNVGTVVLNGSTLSTKKWKSYIYLKGCDNVTGATVPNTNDLTVATFMNVQFSNSADQAANYAEWHIQVPDDADTAVDPRGKVTFKLTGADTGTQRYVLSMASVANSAAYGGTVGTAINLDYGGDGSGASGDVEQVGYTTLTGWGAAVTVGSHWVIRLARDGDAAQDTSTVDSMLSLVTIEYGVVSQ
jgi:hypothetical protein